MRNLILFDDKNVWTDLLPITYTRPLADIRIGIMTIRQKWQMRFPDAVVSALTLPYLSKKYPTTDADCSTFIAGHILPDDSLAEAIGNLPVGTALMAGDELLAFCGCRCDFDARNFATICRYDSEFSVVHFLYDIFLKNDCEIKRDFKTLTAGRQSQPLPE